MQIKEARKGSHAIVE